MRKNLFFLFCMLMFTKIEAQQVKTDSATFYYPHEMIISAARIDMPANEVPFSLSILGKETLRKLPRGVAMDEALKLVPGVKVDNQANGSRVHLSMRGQGILTERGIRGIKVLIDDIPVNDPTGFAADFFDVDFNNVKNIEVLRGPAASLYGGSASGGIISILTNSAPLTPFFGEVTGIGGSNNFWKGAARLGGYSQDLNYALSFSRTGGDGYREHTHFWGDNFYGKATYTPSKYISLTPVVYWTDVFHENPEGINLEQYNQDPKQANPDAVPYNEYLETNRVTGGLNGTIAFDDFQRIQFNAYLRKTKFTEANNRTFNHRDIFSPGATLQYVLKSGNSGDLLHNTISAGTDLQWQNIDEYRVDNILTHEGTVRRSDEKIKQSGLGLFLIDKLNVDNWGFMASLRYDKINNELVDNLKNPYDLSGNADFSKVTGRLGVTFNFIPELNFYGNWGQGFLPPATEELAQNPDNFGGFNSHLTYASSNEIDLGVRGLLNDSFNYDLTGFYMTTKNDFDRYRISDSLRNQETFYRNVGSSRRFGVELSTAYSPVRDLKLMAAYTYSNFKYTNDTPVRILMDDPSIIKYTTDGNLLPNCPEHQLYIELQYALLKSLKVSISSDILSKTYIDGANIESEAAEGYALFNAHLSYDLVSLGFKGEFNLSARNITDKKYVAFTEPDPGGNAYQPGAGREFFAGFKLGF